MFSGIYHVAYLTDDAAAALRFYEQVLGGSLIDQATGADGKSKLVFVRVGETEVELIEPADKSGLAGRTGLVLDHVGYLVEDIDATIAEMRSRGIKFMSDATYRNPLGHRLIYLDSTTTNGAKMHLAQR